MLYSYFPDIHSIYPNKTATYVSVIIILINKEFGYNQRLTEHAVVRQYIICKYEFIFQLRMSSLPS